MKVSQKLSLNYTGGISYLKVKLPDQQVFNNPNVLVHMMFRKKNFKSTRIRIFTIPISYNRIIVVPNEADV